MNRNRVAETFAILEVLDLLADISHREKRKREPNVKRDRRRVEDFIDSWSDTMFKRQFRLTREDFSGILNAIDNKYPISDLSRQKAINSSGSEVSNKLRLYITLRILSGASYLDMIWYGVNVDTVPSLFLDMLEKIDQVIDNIK